TKCVTTAGQWSICTDPHRMLRMLAAVGRLNARKLRLLGAACCRRAWHLLSDGRSYAAVRAAERLADGLLPDEEKQSTWSMAHDPVQEARYHADRPRFAPVTTARGAAAWSITEDPLEAANAAAELALYAVAEQAVGVPVGGYGDMREFCARLRASPSGQAEL